MLLWTIHSDWLETRSLLEMVGNPGKPAAHPRPGSKISITQPALLTRLRSEKLVRNAGYSFQLGLNRWFAGLCIAGRSPLPAVE